MEKHSESRLSYLFAHLHLLSSYSFSSTLLSSDLSLLSASALLCFSSVHIVGSLTSKLPSIMSMCQSTIQYIVTVVPAGSPGVGAIPPEGAPPQTDSLITLLSYMYMSYTYSAL